MFNKQKPMIAIVAFFCFFLSASQAFAHAAIVWAYVEGDKVFVEAFFANGTRIQDTKVIVLDENEKVLLEGKTDKKGNFNYKPAIKKRQSIVVMAGESHIGDFEITEQDLKDINIM